MKYVLCIYSTMILWLHFIINNFYYLFIIIIESVVYWGGIVTNSPVEDRGEGNIIINC